jgi:hypothetical protein
VTLSGLAISPDGCLAALGQEDGGIDLLDTTMLKVLA